ncbi:BCCT family transporter [Cobetia sp. ICG0124]|uniref:BCCT family transporter n=1 Tax=Cobetia sp. ICG0124 TaxID=2053669 RepID=UPI000FD6E317|nr:BCCT family transporter [Cobetia sp. ICG0124]
MFGASVRPLVFWPPFILLFASVLASLIDLDSFLAVTTNLNNQVLSKLGWLFSITALSMVVACLILFRLGTDRREAAVRVVLHHLHHWRGLFWHAEPLITPPRWWPPSPFFDHVPALVVHALCRSITVPAP